MKNQRYILILFPETISKINKLPSKNSITQTRLLAKVEYAY